MISRSARARGELACRSTRTPPRPSPPLPTHPASSSPSPLPTAQHSTAHTPSLAVSDSNPLLPLSSGANPSSQPFAKRWETLETSVLPPPRRPAAAAAAAAARHGPAVSSALQAPKADSCPTLLPSAPPRALRIPQVDAWIAQLQQCKTLSEADIKRLCEKVRRASPFPARSLSARTAAGGLLLPALQTGEASLKRARGEGRQQLERREGGREGRIITRPALDRGPLRPVQRPLHPSATKSTLTDALACSPFARALAAAVPSARPVPSTTDPRGPHGGVQRPAGAVPCHRLRRHPRPVRASPSLSWPRLGRSAGQRGVK